METLSPDDLALLGSGLPVLESVSLRTGAIVQYRQGGESDAPALILLHGLGSHSAGWRGVLAALSDRFRVVAWDAPGFGGSTPLAPDSPGVMDYARHVLDFADSLGVGSFHLAGSSWGGVIAAAVAENAADRVRSLTLLVPNACFGGVPEPDHDAILNMLLSPELVLAAEPEAFAAILTAPGTPEIVLGLVRVLKDQVTARGYAQAVRMMGNTDTVSIAHRISTRTLVLAGSADTLAPADRHAIPVASAIAGAELKMHEGCGHLLKLEAPAWVAGAIGDHAGADGV